MLYTVVVSYVNFKNAKGIKLKMKKIMSDSFDVFFSLHSAS